MKFLKRTFYLETYGCSANVADSERLLRQLFEDAWTRVDNIYEADLTILNTCAVKNPTEKKILKRINEISTTSPNTTLIITGCLPAISLTSIKRIITSFGAIFDTKSTYYFKNILHRLNAGETNIEFFSSKKEVHKKIDIIPFLTNPAIGILTINEGCDGNCSFCGTKLARGSTVSYLPEKLISQAKSYFKNGVKILWITSQDTGAYYWHGTDQYWELPELLDALCQLPYKFRLRIGMLNPDHAFRFLDRLIGVMAKNPQIYQFLHLPMQSGSDKILELMKRRYTADEYELIITELRKSIPDIGITTDIITGFPKETENDFQLTKDLVLKLCPDMVNISRYGARPNTVAASMTEQIHGKVSKQRARELTKLWQNKIFQKNKKWMNWEGKVVIEEYGHKSLENQGASLISRNNTYRQIIIPADGILQLGDMTKIHVTKTGIYFHYGEQLISSEPHIFEYISVT